MKVKVHLDETLRKEHKKRAMPIRNGDKVKVLRGSFRGSVGKVVEINRAKGTLKIDGVERTKADGSKIKAPVHASNTEIIELNLSDKLRKEKVKK